MPGDALFVRARAAALATMTDTCTIRRDPDFEADSTLNTTTGVLTAAAPATVEVYSGPCLVSPLGRQEDRGDEGGAAVVQSDYRAKIPADAASTAIGDILTVDTSRDPLLVGQEFVIDGDVLGTQTFQRRIPIRRVVRADAQ
jgi:hypothetical protein